MGEKWTPEKARRWLEEKGVDEQSWPAIMQEQVSLQFATSHELKAAVVIARGDEPRDQDEVYQEMRRLFPQA